VASRAGRVGVPAAARRAASLPAGTLREVARGRGLVVVDRADPGYPRRLAELPDGPDVLFLRGSLPSDVPAVAIVGTRRCTGYGTGLARRFAAAIAQAGWCVVSGLARGIDGAAHEGSLEGAALGTASGPGIAVLGSGADVCYPPEHRRLADRLVGGGGAIVSEYPPGARPLGWRFPPRNRIIAGLAEAVVVVESAERGGALVTAAAGAELGRSVFAVPGDVDRSASRGCNLLIRDGAAPVLDPDDLLEALSLVGPPVRERSDPLETAILGAVRTPMALDVLVDRVGGDPAVVMATVTRLEIEGVVRRDGSGAVVGR
ncbi:MAG TPA: DNA-processing protein DprA, partial [Acidimicrobiia bacterium]|nr:DNA-processing protein DprA [Acidimicrobiia bacterium]